MAALFRPGRDLCVVAALCAVFLSSAAGCGSSGGVVPAGGAGGFVLVSFLQDGLDNLALTDELEFRFNADVDPATVSPASIQIRDGAAGGLAVPGTLRVRGDTVLFEPDLPGRCDYSDGSFRPDTRYAVTLVGAAESASLRDVAGRALAATSTHGFGTRDASDPGLFEDSAPGEAPVVTAATPVDGDEAVAVVDGNRVALTISKNLDPCSVDASSVRFHVYQLGDKDTTARSTAGGGRPTGFSTPGGDTSDQAPGDPFAWGTAATMPDVSTLLPPERILADIRLVQSFDETQIVITPRLGFSIDHTASQARFPENALIVVQLTAAVHDPGGQPLTPFVMAFTTENLPIQTYERVIENRGETPYDEQLTTARLDERPPGVVQGFLLFSGDGDNGADLLQPSLPQSDALCETDYQADDGVLDDFDPAADVLLDTGGTRNRCPNDTDGSEAVVWEFRTLRVRSGVTVRVIGVNPAIGLVRGDAVLAAGGRLLVRGDGTGGSPPGAGEGDQPGTTSAGTQGGVGVAGGGDGGSSPAGSGLTILPRYGEHGRQGYHHDPISGSPAADIGTEGGAGGGHGNISARWNEQLNPNNRNTPSGGGGGHATSGQAGTALGTGDIPTSLDGSADGAAGGAYGDTSDRMRTPEAGSGGGAGGELRPFTGNLGRGPGGAGGAGGGFIDITCGGDLAVLGTIDAAGSRGGSNPGGIFTPSYAWQPGTGGGGGGSGGGIRLLTLGELSFGSTTVITAAGGAGGAGGASNGTNPPLNNGGAGGAGRIVFEDADSIVTGIAAASVTPGEGATGYRRASLDGTRFTAGELTPVAVTELFAVGPREPTYVIPVQDAVAGRDFTLGVPGLTSRGTGRTAVLLEARGFEMLPDGSADTAGVLAAPTPWHTVGHFTDSGNEADPVWQPSQPPLADIGGALPAGNSGAAGIGNLDRREYLQLRITFFLAAGITAADAGPWLDRWVLRVTRDQ